MYKDCGQLSEALLITKVKQEWLSCCNTYGVIDKCPEKCKDFIPKGALEEMECKNCKTCRHCGAWKQYTIENLYALCYAPVPDCVYHSEKGLVVKDNNNDDDFYISLDGMDTRKIINCPSWEPKITVSKMGNEQGEK